MAGILDLLRQAVAHHGQGRLAEADRLYRQVLAREPGNLDALNNGALIAIVSGRADDAVAALLRVVALKPDFAEAHNNLGVALRLAGRPHEAEACHARALTLKPDYVDALINLGFAAQLQDRIDDALGAYRRAIGIQPAAPLAHNNLGTALYAKGAFAEAEAAYREAVRLQPAYADAHANLGVALKEQLRLAEAKACYARALSLRDDHVDAHWNLSHVLLLEGDFAAAWPHFEWRWRTPPLTAHRRAFDRPAWNGDAPAGRTILLYAEQGFGDAIHFARYAPMLAARGFAVVLEAPRPLARLFASLAGGIKIVARGDPLPAFHCHAALMSLPGLVGTTLASVPADVPYLAAETDRAAAWRRRLDSLPGRKVGLAWQGSRNYARDAWRSIPLARFEPLLDVPGFSFVSVQKAAGEEQIPATRFSDRLADWTAEMDTGTDAFLDIAAVMTGLDLVITSDTAVAHLAGALGRPAWIVLGRMPDWRWLLGCDDSPWYPTLRLFRQKEFGTWDPALAEVAQALTGF